MLGLGNLQYKFILRYTLYITLSVSSWQYIYQYWPALQSMSVWSYWSFNMMMQKRQFIEMFMDISGATWLWIKTKKDKSVNNQVASASEAQNLKVEVVIMCCLVSAATHQRVQWYVRRENGGFMNWQRKLKRPGEKNLLQCPFIHQESHTKWCKIQL